MLVRILARHPAKKHYLPDLAAALLLLLLYVEILFMTVEEQEVITAPMKM